MLLNFHAGFVKDTAFQHSILELCELVYEKSVRRFGEERVRVWGPDDFFYWVHRPFWWRVPGVGGGGGPPRAARGSVGPRGSSDASKGEIVGRFSISAKPETRPDGRVSGFGFRRNAETDAVALSAGALENTYLQPSSQICVETAARKYRGLEFFSRWCCRVEEVERTGPPAESTDEFFQGWRCERAEVQTATTDVLIDREEESDGERKVVAQEVFVQ